MRTVFNDHNLNEEFMKDSFKPLEDELVEVIDELPDLSL